MVDHKKLSDTKKKRIDIPGCKELNKEQLIHSPDNSSDGSIELTPKIHKVVTERTEKNI